jgi:hypothetical protein
MKGTRGDVLDNTVLFFERYRPNAKVQVMICRYTIRLPCVLKTKERLDDTIVLCMIVRLKRHLHEQFFLDKYP